MELIQKNSEVLFKSLIDISVESWRFSRLFARLISKLDAGEGARYTSQYRYYLKRLEESLENTVDPSVKTIMHRV